MAFVPRYDHDIFISYSHDDNCPVGEGPGWVDKFHKDLANWLVRRRKLKGLKVWRDLELMGNTELHGSIKKNIERSALFFVMHSRAYRESEYCRKELAWFTQCQRKLPGGLIVGEYKCVFNILLNNFPEEDWPSPLANAVGFRMHDANSREDLGDFTSPHDVMFEKQLRKIVDAVEKTLRAMATAASPQKTAVCGDPRIRMFVADVADSLKPLRERLITEIGNRAQILDRIPPPLEYEAHAQRLRQLSREAQFCVHLLDKLPGREILDRKETTYPRAQVEIAAKWPTHQLIWITEAATERKIENEEYRYWLHQIETGRSEEARYEFVRSSRNNLIDLVLQKLDALGTAPDQQLEPVSFLIDTHQKDQRFAFELAARLAAQGAAVDFNQEYRDAMQNLAHFEQAMLQVRNLIIMFGQVAASWLQNRVKMAIKVAAEQYGDDAPVLLENMWIYCLPGSQCSKVVPNLPRLIKIDFLDNSHSETIDAQIVSRLLASSNPRDR